MHIRYLRAEKRARETCESEEYDADIIILSINRLHHTLAAVRSSLKQRMVNARIAVLDQGSSDETLSTLKAEILAYPTVQLVTAGHNLGVGGGRNFLTSIGKGRIIVGLDNDAVFADDYVVHNALKLFDKEAKLGALGFHILSRDGSRTDESCWGYPSRLKSRCKERFLTTTFVGAGHAIRRTTWNEAGEYDPNLFFTWEEYDFCLRAIAQKWVIMYDGSLCVCHHAAGEERVRWSTGRQRLFVRNRLIIGRKWGQSWLSLLPRIIAYTINGAINRNLRSTFAGIFDAISCDQALPKQEMTARMHNYLLKNEKQHRGSLYERLRTEVLKPLQGNS